MLHTSKSTRARKDPNAYYLTHSPEYAKLKEERSQVLWRAVERVIPDIRQRAELTLVSVLLTHLCVNTL